MQVKFRQSGWYGCGSFTLANIFDDHRFVLELPEGHSERIPDIQRKMNKFHRALFIDAIFLTNWHLKAGNRLTWDQRTVLMMPRAGVTKEVKETMCVPFIVYIARHNGNLHSMAVILNLKDGLYYRVDSCEEGIAKFTLKELIHAYHIVSVCVFRFWKGEQANFLVAPKEYFSHIFSPED